MGREGVGVGVERYQDDRAEGVEEGLGHQEGRGQADSWQRRCRAPRTVGYGCGRVASVVDRVAARPGAEVRRKEEPNRSKIARCKIYFVKVATDVLQVVLVGQEEDEEQIPASVSLKFQLAVKRLIRVYGLAQRSIQ